jgi:hypothetical protein
MKGGRSNYLHVVVALAEDPFGSLPHRGESLYLEVVKAGTVGNSISVFNGLRSQFGIVQGFELGFDFVYGDGDGLELFESLALAGAEDFRKEWH